MHVVRWYLSDDAKLQRKGLPRKKSSPDNERKTMLRLQVADCQLDADPSASHNATSCLRLRQKLTIVSTLVLQQLALDSLGLRCGTNNLFIT